MNGAKSATTTAGFTSDTDFTPRDVSGLQLWWRADAGVPTGFGDSWQDQSGQENHGLQTYGAAVPRLIPNAFNGLPAMRFDGGDATGFTARLTTTKTVFWVMKEDPAAPPAYRVLLGDSSTSDFASEYYGQLWRSCCTSSSILGGTTRINGQVVDGIQTVRPRTMSVLSLVTAGNVNASNFGYSPGYSPWQGDLAELVLYDTALSIENRKKVEDYLRIKYWDVTAAPGNHQVTLSWTTRPAAGRR